MADNSDVPTIRTYPEMDAKIVGILRSGGQEATMREVYAAQRIEELEAALAASEAARRQAVEEWAVRGACLRTLRARLPQPTLDDFCDWQRDQIDAVLARPMASDEKMPTDAELAAMLSDQGALGISQADCTRVVHALIDERRARRRAEERIETLVATVDRWREDCEGEYRNRVAAEERERGLQEAGAGMIHFLRALKAFIERMDDDSPAAVAALFKVEREIDRVIASLAPSRPEPPAMAANPWRAELDARIERYVAAFSRNPATLTDEELADWRRRRARLERDVVSAFTDFAMREAKNRNGIVSDTPAPPAMPPADGLREALEKLVAFVLREGWERSENEERLSVLASARAALAAVPVAEGRGAGEGEKQ